MANVEALNVCTMALLVFFLARPQSRWIRCVAAMRSIGVCCRVLLLITILFVP